MAWFDNNNNNNNLGYSNKDKIFHYTFYTVYKAYLHSDWMQSTDYGFNIRL